MLVHSCNDCKHGKDVITHYDINPFYQEGMGCCSNKTARIVKTGHKHGLMDPDDFCKPNKCPFFNEKTEG